MNQNALVQIGVGVAVALILVGIGGWWYNQQKDDEATETNDAAITALDAGGDEDEAIADLERAYHEATDASLKAVISINLGYAYQADGRDEKARAAFERGLEVAPAESVEYYQLQAEIAWLDEDLEAALVAYEKALDINPDDASVLSALGVYYSGFDYFTQEVVDYDKAIAYYEQSLAIENSETVRENVATVYYYLGEYQKAIDMLMQTNLSAKPYNNYWLGWSYWDIGDEANARKYFQTAVDGGVEVEAEVYELLNS